MRLGTCRARPKNGRRRVGGCSSWCSSGYPGWCLWYGPGVHPRYEPSLEARGGTSPYRGARECLSGARLAVYPVADVSVTSRHSPLTPLGPLEVPPPSPSQCTSSPPRTPPTSTLLPLPSTPLPYLTFTTRERYLNSTEGVFFSIQLWIRGDTTIVLYLTNPSLIQYSRLWSTCPNHSIS